MPAPEFRVLRDDAPLDTFVQFAHLHVNEIREGFLTSLGAPLIATLYRAVSRSPDAFFVTASLDGRIVGFLCAATDTRLVYRHVLRRTWLRILPVLARNFLKRRTLVRCWETLTYPSRTTAPNVSTAEILNFCVAAGAQRTGLGRKLFSEMEDEYYRRGVRTIRIVTGIQQTSAIRFYESIGARPVGQIEVHDQAKSLVFSHAIPGRNTVTRPIP